MNFDIPLTTTNPFPTVVIILILLLPGAVLASKPEFVSGFLHGGDQKKVRWVEVATSIVGISLMVIPSFVGIFSMFQWQEQDRQQNEATAVTTFQQAADDTYSVELSEEETRALLSLGEEPQWSDITASTLNWGKETGTIWKSEPVEVVVDGQSQPVQLAWLENKWALVNVLDNPFPEELTRTD